MLGDPPVVEFQGTIFKFRNRKKILSLLNVYLISKMRNQVFSRLSREKEKMYKKKCDTRAKLLFCLLNPIVFFLVAVGLWIP